MDNKKKKALRRVLTIVLFFSFNFSMIGCKNIDNNREETIIRDVVKDIQLYQSSDDKNLINHMYEEFNKKFIKLYNYNKEWYEK